MERKKELKKKAEKEKGDDKVNQSVIVSKNKSDKSKDSSLINFKDLRKNSSIKSKAESVVKKILDLDSDDLSSDTDIVDSSSSSDSDDSIVVSKNLRNISKKLRKNQVFLIILLMTLLRNKCGDSLSYNLNMQVQKLTLMN
jgi:hypothetical protein